MRASWALLAILPFLLGPPAWADQAAIRVGDPAGQGSERAVRDWEPTLAYLNAAIPGQRLTLLPFALAALDEAVAQDFVITNPGNYVEFESRYGVTRLSTVESVGVRLTHRRHGV